MARVAKLSGAVALIASIAHGFIPGTPGLGMSTQFRPKTLEATVDDRAQAAMAEENKASNDLCEISGNPK